MARQDTMTIFPEVEEITKDLTNEQFGIMMRAAMAYRYRREAYSGNDPLIKFAFRYMANMVDRAENAKKAKSDAARERWDRQNNNEPVQNDAQQCNDMQNDAQQCNDMQNDAQQCKQMQSYAPIHSIPIQSIPVQSNKESKADKPPAPAKTARKSYGEFGWVKLTDDEFNRLLNDLGEAEVKRCIAYVDESAQTTGNKNKWRDWNLVVRKCHKQNWGACVKQQYTHGADRLADMIQRGDFDD